MDKKVVPCPVPVRQSSERHQRHSVVVHSQEIQGLRAQVVQVDQQLRLVSSPAYSPLDRDKALAEQNVSTAVAYRLSPIRLHLGPANVHIQQSQGGLE